MRGANLAGAGACNEQSVRPTNLEGARLRGAQLQDAILCWVKLSRADLSEASLQRATLFHADLTEARLWQADLTETYLGWTQLLRANLAGATLTRAYLPGTDLRDAELRGADLTDACYAPSTAPALGSLASLEGVETLWFSPGEGTGLVQLREKLRSAGLRSLERKATYAIEVNETRHLLVFRERSTKACRSGPLETRAEERSRWEDTLRVAEGAIRRVLFDWPVAYGLHPTRAVWILFGLILVFAIWYVIPLVRTGDRAGLYRIWPKERLDIRGAKTNWSELVEWERLQPKSCPAVLARALHFSILSAFHLGWREINVGSWIARVQTQEYTLRATGWVRVVAGVQSLISVYLLALWALTYFGRPCQ